MEFFYHPSSWQDSGLKTIQADMVKPEETLQEAVIFQPSSRHDSGRKTIQADMAKPEETLIFQVLRAIGSNIHIRNHNENYSASTLNVHRRFRSYNYMRVWYRDLYMFNKLISESEIKYRNTIFHQCTSKCYILHLWYISSLLMNSLLIIDHYWFFFSF